MATFEELLVATELPEAALKPLREKWEEALRLITDNNKRVAQVNAARAQDPNNVEYLDALWKSAQNNNDTEIAPIAEKFDAISEEYERLLKQLREHAKKHVPEALSEEKTKEVRKLVNESEPTLKKAKAEFAAMATMVDSFLGSMGKGVEGGLASLLPDIESLKNTRGRKAATGSGEVGQYATRIGGFAIDGRDIQRDGKCNLAIGADSVSNIFGADKAPENKVSKEEIEKALFDHLGIEFRSKKGKDLPESTTFPFTKEINIGDGVKETRTLQITIKKDGANAPAKPADKPADKVETSEPVKVETPKQEVPAAKKAAVAPKK